LLPVGCELDRHRFQYNLAEAATGRAPKRDSAPKRVPRSRDAAE
jgi:hypothetical protein